MDRLIMTRFADDNFREGDVLSMKGVVSGNTIEIKLEDVEISKPMVRRGDKVKWWRKVWNFGEVVAVYDDGAWVKPENSCVMKTLNISDIKRVDK